MLVRLGIIAATVFLLRPLLSPALAGIEAIEIPLLRITDSHTIGDIGLPAPGEWRPRFRRRTSDIDQTTVTGTLTIG
jgi:hypothetical protein